MSHFSVLVIGENPEEQLAPYQENNMGDCPEEHLAFNDITDELKEDYESWCRDRRESGQEPEMTFEEFAEGEATKDEKGRYGYYENPNRKWDYYLLGGRWAGFFKLKEGHAGYKGRPEDILGPTIPQGHADSARIRDIDFNGMQDEAAERAKEEYETMERLLGGRIPLLDYSWEQVLNDSDFQHMSIQEKRELYHNQVAMKKKVEASQQSVDDPEVRGFLIFSDLEEFQCSKEDYMARARQNAISTFAVLKDGEWYERGEMGWFGISLNEKDKEAWREELMSLIVDLPEDTLLSVYDCHI